MQPFWWIEGLETITRVTGDCDADHMSGKLYWTVRVDSCRRFEHSRAIAQSSWARTFKMRTDESAADKSSSTRGEMFFSRAIFTPRKLNRLHAASRTSGEFSPMPAVKMRTHQLCPTTPSVSQFGQWKV